MNPAAPLGTVYRRRALPGPFSPVDMSRNGARFLAVKSRWRDKTVSGNSVPEEGHRICTKAAWAMCAVSFDSAEYEQRRGVPKNVVALLAGYIGNRASLGLFDTRDGKLRLW